MIATFTLAAGLGLLGFVEPCSVGGHLFFLKAIEGSGWISRLLSTSLLVGVRCLVMGLLGVLAVQLGEAFGQAQKALWLVFGLAYIAIGALYCTDRISPLTRRLGLRPSAAEGKGAVAIGAILGFNIPACAAPILFVLFGTAATLQSSAQGFLIIAIFGFFLSAPLFLFVFVPGLSGLIDRFTPTGRSTRLALGIVFLLLGAWSVWFGLFVELADWA